MSKIADAFLERHPELMAADQSSLAWQRAVATLAWPLEIYFRFRLRDVEKIPKGPAVIIANHGAGAPFVIPLLHRAWFRARPGENARGLVHQLVWQPPVRWLPIIPKIGGVLAHPRVAGAVLDRGEAVFAFPGGDLEAMRPFWRKSRASFGGRHGFVRLARAHRVPIVPIAIRGSHLVYFMLPWATGAARVLGVKRLVGLKAFPITIGIVLIVISAIACGWRHSLWPLFLASLALALVPFPARIEARVLDPVDVPPDVSDAELALTIEKAITSGLEARDDT